jgi:hypothetical protein
VIAPLFAPQVVGLLCEASIITGVGFTITFTVFVLLQVPTVTVTVYVPPAVMVAAFITGF